MPRRRPVRDGRDLLPDHRRVRRRGLRGLLPAAGRSAVARIVAVTACPRGRGGPAGRRSSDPRGARARRRRRAWGRPRAGRSDRTWSRTSRSASAERARARGQGMSAILPSPARGTLARDGHDEEVGGAGARPEDLPRVPRGERAGEPRGADVLRAREALLRELRRQPPRRRAARALGGGARGRAGPSPEAYFVPAYVGHMGWVGVRLDRDLPWSEIEAVLESAYLHRAPKKLASAWLSTGRGGA